MQDAVLTIRAHGLKATPCRLAILQALKESKKPLSAMEIFTITKKEKIDQATVYRILEIFLKNGLVRLIQFKQDFAYYEIGAQRHHHHIICKNCFKISDVENCDLSKAEKNILKKSGFQSIQEHSLEFFGTCAECANN